VAAPQQVVGFCQDLFLSVQGQEASPGPCGGVLCFQLAVCFDTMTDMDLEGQIFEDTQDALPPEFDHMTADDVKRRTKLLENEIRVLKDESTRLNNDIQGLQEKVSWWSVDRACNPWSAIRGNKVEDLAA
jgi:hypothetical protein